MKNHTPRSVVSAALLSISALLPFAGSPHAVGTVIEEPFSVAVDPFPGAPYSDWYVAYRGAATDFLSVDEYGLKTIRPASSVPDSSSHSATAFYVGTQGSVIDGSLQTFTVTGTTRYSLLESGGSAISSTFGFIVGASNLTFGSNGYYVAYNPGAGALAVWKNPGTGNVLSLDAAVAQVSLGGPLLVDHDYQITVQVQNGSLQAWIYDGDSALGSLSYSDAGIGQAGYLGWRSAFGNTNIASWVRNVEISVIPEPSEMAAVLALIALAAVAVGRRSRM